MSLNLREISAGVFLSLDYSHGPHDTLDTYESVFAHNYVIIDLNLRNPLCGDKNIFKIL